MAEKYQVRKFEPVNNSSYQFFEVAVNGKFQFQEFVDNLKDEQRDLKNALIFKKYIKLDNSKEDEYIIIKANDIKSMLACAGEEYESILPILMLETEDKFTLSKKIKNNNK